MEQTKEPACINTSISEAASVSSRKPCLTSLVLSVVQVIHWKHFACEIREWRSGSNLNEIVCIKRNVVITLSLSGTCVHRVFSAVIHFN